MQANQPRLGGSPSKLFATLQDLLAKSSVAASLCVIASVLKPIVSALLKELLLAPNAVPRFSTPRNLTNGSSPVEDAVSIPSSGDTTDVDEPLTPVEPAPAINPNAAILFIPGSFNGRSPIRPAGLSVVTSAIPSGLVPTSPPLSVFNFRANGRVHPQPEKTVPPFVRGRALTRNPPNSPRSETPLRRSDVAVLVPRPLAPAHSRLRPSYVDDSPTFKPRFAGSRARKNKYGGNSNPSRKSDQHNRKVFLEPLSAAIIAHLPTISLPFARHEI
ncbi:hypothetical protein B0H14DRAFT_3673542 [Mycena olivaceomarginata]|nr:hypothetical protein B0H14DRAFT_3673542 [Mycena olivaceomarginata]